MNFQCYTLALIFTVVVVNGNPIEEKRTLRTSMAEAIKALDDLHKSVEEQITAATPPLEALAQQASEDRGKFVSSTVQPSHEIVDEYVQLANAAAENLGNSGYDVEACNDEWAFKMEGDMIFTNIKMCANKQTDQVTEVITTSQKEVSMTINEVEKISNTLTDCGDKPECIDKAMADLATATKGIPEEIKAASDKAQAAYNQLANSLPTCSENKMEELRGKEDSVRYETFLCMADVVLVKEEPTTDSPTTNEVTTEKSSGFAHLSSANALLLPILLVVCKNFRINI